MPTKNHPRHGRANGDDDLATYSDGQPLDSVRYFQAKLLLKPDRLSSLERFHDLEKIVSRTARSMNVDLIQDLDSGHPPRVREIIFADTPDFRLYKRGFILRRRIPYVDGFPAGDPEIVFKFRYPEQQSAAALDVRPRIAGKYRIKFKMQALPLSDRIGGYRTLYSHNCQFGVSQVRERDRTAMSTLSHIFPALSALNAPSGGRVKLVNEGIIEELLVPLAKLDFGKGLVAKSSLALWRTRGAHVPIIGEYSFQLKFKHREDISPKAEKLVKDFFVGVQRDIKEWIALGTTKTGLVYRLNGNTIERRE